ncbi:MAG: hypothetical protein AAB675_02540 [Patescibacteria group bacterium]
MAKRERPPVFDPQILEIMREIEANAVDIDRELHPTPPQINRTVLERERLDRKIMGEGRPVIVFDKPATLRKVA